MVFLDVAQAFDTVSVDGLLYILRILIFRSYLLKTISSYLNSRMFEVFLQTATSNSRRLRAGVAQGTLIPIQCVCRRHAFVFLHVELALHKEDTVLTATILQLVLLVRYQETYLSDLER